MTPETEQSPLTQDPLSVPPAAVTPIPQKSFKYPKNTPYNKNYDKANYTSDNDYIPNTTDTPDEKIDMGVKDVSPPYQFSSPILVWDTKVPPVGVKNVPPLPCWGNGVTPIVKSPEESDFTEGNIKCSIYVYMYVYMYT
jgi:hypothetical protein